MKNNKIVSGIKTAGVVTTAVFTMASCGNKQLSESQLATVQHKTDSALTVHPEYRMATNLMYLRDEKVKNFHDANKCLLKIYSKEYIKQNIQDIRLRRFMLGVLGQEAVISDLFCEEVESDSVCYNGGHSVPTMPYIRKNQRWFYDLMLFLSDKYTDKQLLNSEFFNVINDPRLKRKFESNIARIDSINSSVEFAVERKKIIREQTWNKYAKEVQKKR